MFRKMQALEEYSWGVFVSESNQGMLIKTPLSGLSVPRCTKYIRTNSTTNLLYVFSRVLTEPPCFVCFSTLCGSAGANLPAQATLKAARKEVDRTAQSAEAIGGVLKGGGRGQEWRKRENGIRHIVWSPLECNGVQLFVFFCFVFFLWHLACSTTQNEGLVCEKQHLIWCTWNWYKDYCWRWCWFNCCWDL